MDCNIAASTGGVRACDCLELQREIKTSLSQEVRKPPIEV